MKKIYFILLYLALGVSSVSCVQSPEFPSQSLSLENESVIATYMGAEYAVTVNANTKWLLQNDYTEWISADITESTGSATLNLRVLANDGDERTAKLLVSSADGSIVREISVVQLSPLAKGFISISALRNLYIGKDKLIKGNTARIRGFVTTDVDLGNWDSESFVIQDSYTEAGSALIIEYESGAYPRGAEVAVAIDGARLKADASGRLVLKPSAAPVVTETSKVIPEPLTITYSQLNAGDYESMYVRVENYQLSKAQLGSTWSASPLFEAEDETLIQLLVSENAVFGVNACPALAGNIVGIAGAQASASLYPVNAADMELTESRFAVNPGLTSLPYVFSFYCSSNTNETPKYVKYTPVSYNASTKMLKGVLATDADLSLGGVLSVASYGKAVTDIANNSKGKATSKFWAEKGAHDNVNTSGFLTYPEKYGNNAAPEECGYYLDVPLQMDMPEKFNVSFGMAGNTWTKANWAVEYFAPDRGDAGEWVEAGRIFIDKVCTDGSPYLYFTVPVTLETTLGPGSTLKLKFVPKGGYVVGHGYNPPGGNMYDGHGSSGFLRLHSAIVLSKEEEGSTVKPANAVYFQPFDKLTAGMDYFLGDKLAAFANYCADSLSTWSDEKREDVTGRGKMTGTYVHERPGYAQIGYVDTENPISRTQYVNNIGSLETPALGHAGNLELSFKAAAYKSPAIRPAQKTDVLDVKYPDLKTIVVEVLDGGTINGITSTKASVLNLPTDRFETFSLSIKGATENTRIRFTSENAVNEETGQEVTSFTRWFIDDIYVYASNNN